MSQLPNVPMSQSHLLICHLFICHLLIWLIGSLAHWLIVIQTVR